MRAQIVSPCLPSISQPSDFLFVVQVGAHAWLDKDLLVVGCRSGSVLILSATGELRHTITSLRPITTVCCFGDKIACGTTYVASNTFVAGQRDHGQAKKAQCSGGLAGL